MILTFQKLRWKNLLSYGDQFTEIHLAKSPSTLITGDNGAGKSTILEALVFCLYGKPYRKIKKQELVNSKNGRGVEIEVEFSVEDAGARQEYLVRRGIKPDIFEIYQNGTLLNQSSTTKDYQSILDKKILRCSYEVFTQIIVVGKAVHTPFMTMKAADRRGFVETILNLDVFGVMNKVLTSRLGANKDQSSDAKTALALASRDVEHKTREIEISKGTSIENYQREQDRLGDEIKTIKRTMCELMAKREEAEKKVTDVDMSSLLEVKGKAEKARGMMSQISTRLTDAKNAIKSVEHSMSCHACGQKIPARLQDERKSTLEATRAKLQEAKDGLSKKITGYDEKMTAIQPVIDLNASLRQEIATIDALLASHAAQVKALQVKKNSQKQPNLEPTEALIADLETLTKAEDAARQALDDVLDEGKYLNALKGMLGDAGVKQILVKRFVPMINQSINHHLSKLGFFGKFTLDQNFEETIKARGFDELGYHSYSEGEKLRIDLAVLMAWREMAKLQGIINTNLLIFDEVMDASMDAAGTAAFAQILTGLTGTNIFVVSHSPEKIGDLVRGHIEVAKDRRGFSKFKKAKR